MRIYPAIDLDQGKVVRLLQGDFQKETVYSQNPQDVASHWESQGAEWIHVVDLEGAKTGQVKNLPALLKIRKAVHCQIQFGGGLRDMAVMDTLLKEGIDRVVVGTKSLDESFLAKALEKFGDRVAVGLDVHHGVVRMEGWTKSSSQTVEEAIRFLNKFLLGTLIYTDIQKDGMLQGPNFEGLGEMLKEAHARIILSGGVGSLSDIEKACQIRHPHFEGMIVGKALYEKQFTLREALQLTGRYQDSP